MTEFDDEAEIHNCGVRMMFCMFWEKVCCCCCRNQGPQKSTMRLDYQESEVFEHERIELAQGDITKLEVDAIVNAARKSLLGGGGVDGAIHEAAGAGLREECAALGGCETGQAKISGAHKLPAKYVIHTVGPMGEQPEMLARCYVSCLELARQHNIRRIAFPCISTGSYGYPPAAAARVAVDTVLRRLRSPDMDSIKHVVFCVFLEEDRKLYAQILSDRCSKPKGYGSLAAERVATQPDTGSTGDRI